MITITKAEEEVLNKTIYVFFKSAYVFAFFMTNKKLSAIIF